MVQFTHYFIVKNNHSLVDTRVSVIVPDRIFDWYFDSLTGWDDYVTCVDLYDRLPALELFFVCFVLHDFCCHWIKREDALLCLCHQWSFIGSLKLVNQALLSFGKTLIQGPLRKLFCFCADRQIPVLFQEKYRLFRKTPKNSANIISVPPVPKDHTGDVVVVEFGEEVEFFNSFSHFY